VVFDREAYVKNATDNQKQKALDLLKEKLLSQPK
jgi:hypothetical protein